MDNDSVKKELRAVRISAMNILAGREHSIIELRKKLKKKFSKNDDIVHLDELIEIVLQQLLDDNLLNEARFTECFIRSRINKGSGPVRIRHELMERGISSELTNDYLDDSYDFWQQHIEAVRNKRFGIQLPEDYKEQTKQSRFLYQRGFSGEFIRRLFNEV
ncbi:MAG: recombination regulator RecX [Gammaproteobacteria bacterium]|nr:MAG: recombination regulator RecX [Gammaproteobacteria bacterium]